jgi:hypothetical protein
MARIKVTMTKDADGRGYEGTCTCGCTLFSYVQFGTTLYPGIGDLECDDCGKVWNVFGQEIAHPQGQGFDYAGEYEGED